MKLRARQVMVPVVLLFIALAVYWKHAEAPASDAATRVVRVGAYDNAPKVYIDSNGKPAGLFIELLQPIARQEGWSVHYVRCTWAECLRQLEDGRIDLMPDVAYSATRSRRFDFHDVAAAYSWSQLYRLPQVPIHSFTDLKHRRIAVLRDGIQERYLQRLLASDGLQFTFLPVDTYDEGFAAVRAGRADAVVTNIFYGQRHARQFGLVETPIMFEPVGLYFATAKGRNDDLLKRIDVYLTRWREDPDSVYFTALRHAMAPTLVTVTPSWLKPGLYIVASVVLILIGFSLLLRWQVRRTTAELDSSNRRLEQVINTSPVVLYLLQRTDSSVISAWVSPNVERLFGFTAEQVLAPDWWIKQVHPDDRDSALSAMEELFRNGHLIHEYRLFDAQGEVRYIRDELRVLGAVAGQPEQIVGTWNDLTESREQAARLDYLIHHDTLTGLCNRMLLHKRLSDAIKRAEPVGGQIAVLSIDLDRFKNINDTLGHTEGDQLLRLAASKLEAIVGPDDILAHPGGDEFVLVLGGDTSVRQATGMAQRILRTFAAPLRIGPRDLIVTASVGISLYPASGEDADTLLKHAELALYEAKNQGRNTYRLFTSELSAGALERLIMENSLRGAVAREELVLHYQPQLDLRNGGYVGVEALVRWKHPDIGLVHPGRFIGLAEEAGLINEIGDWVLYEACRQMMAWQAQGLRVPRVAVNLSMLQLERATLAAQVAAVLGKTGLEARRLELEITESSIMREADKAITALRDLKAQGVSISIDDFGTGHSSLAYLKRLPIDRLKIDQSFVRDIGRDRDDEAIARAVIELARSLGLETVAEGVERAEQLDFLHAEGCEFVQGYLIGKPVPAQEVHANWREDGTMPLSGDEAPVERGA